jgi:Ca2+-binding EF-hand superfamily protein
MMSGISGMSGMMGGMRPDPQQMFNRTDKDGSGGIDSSELSTMADKIAEDTGIEIDAESLMAEYDGDGDGVLNQDEANAAMESLRDKLGPPPPPDGGGMNQGAGVYGQDGAADESSFSELLEALSESEEEEEATGIIQEWLETLQGNNDSYNPIDTRA